ncbi:uncharacterized protein DS421_14g474340 [Arachis hypogaea]|nr:uncharacterized protein DS421_14g474340 [Arachis hypogaea]
MLFLLLRASPPSSRFSPDLRASPPSSSFYSASFSLSINMPSLPRSVSQFMF